MTILLNPCYFGSISYWLAAVNAEEVVFEIWDNYQKQTQRNRCNILGANGKLTLTIPVNYTQKNRQLYRDVRISGDTNWQDLHLKSFDSAYKMSPFYEYYIDDIRLLYTQSWDFLLDFNMACFETMVKLLELSLRHRNTESYNAEQSKVIDFRGLSAKKAHSPFSLKPYTQVFSEKHGFTSDLSILDLLFNEGPNTENFLKKHRLTV